MRREQGTSVKRVSAIVLHTPPIEERVTTCFRFPKKGEAFDCI